MTIDRAANLTVMVRSGLGNRIRVLCGGLSLGTAWGLTEIDVEWPTGRDFEPDLDDLWSFPVRRVGMATTATRRFRGRTYDNHVSDLSRPEARFTVIRTQHALDLPATCEDWGAQLRAAKPHDRISNRVRELWQSEGLGSAPFAGVMIRSGSKAHAKTLESSPLEWYLDMCTRLREERQIERFFLSTDSPETEAEFSRHFPDTVTINPKGRYNSTDGVQDAIGDLYLLASAGVILGPYWSSFVTMSEKLSPATPSYNPKSDPGELSELLNVGIASDPLAPWDR